MDREKDRIEIDLWVTKEQKERWNSYANVMCLSLYEYIRRCVDAHTNILEKDQFELIKKLSFPLREG